MNLKKFAVRGIIILAICVALCMFFSGTVRTITTPKVRLTSAKRGKLEERVELAGRPAFPEVDEVTFALPEDMTLAIAKVNTREGYTVKAGDVLVEGKLSNFETQRKAAQEAYDSASEQLMTLENKNRGIRVTKRDQAYADAFFALRDARRKAVSLELTMEAQLTREGLERTEEGYPEGASDELKRLTDDWREAAAAQIQQLGTAQVGKAPVIVLDLFSAPADRHHAGRGPKDALIQIAMFTDKDLPVKAVIHPD